MTVLERPRSCCGPTRLAHHDDLQSSQSSKPHKLHRSPFERRTRSLLWYPFRCVEWKATSVTAVSRVLRRFHPEKPSCFSKFSCRSFIKHMLEQLIVTWKNLRVVVIISHNSAGFHWTYHFQILYKRLKSIMLNSTSRTVKFVNYCRMWTLMVF